MDKKCVQCGKIAVLPPFCLQCMLSMTDEEYERKRALQAVVDMFPVQDASECKMCGKPTADGRPDGFCGSCRQVWNG